MSGALRAAELEVLYTANTAGVEKAEKSVKDSAQRIESKPITQKVDADASDALAGMDRVEAEAKKLVSERAVLKVDADIERTEKSLQRAKDKVEDLAIRAEAGFEVTAETKRAETAVARLAQQAERLKTLRAGIEIDASTAKAESELEQLADKAQSAAGTAGEKGGASFVRSLDGATRGAGQKVGDVVGGDIEGSLIAALTAIPVAGGIILGGVAIGKTIVGAIQDGLQQEVGFDRLEALTGINTADALRIGRAAGEAYANVFGDSVESNLDTARLALQFNILDADSTNAEAKRTIEGLAGIADVMRDEVQPVATTTTTLLKTGLARSAQEAFDLIAAGEREGANRAGDLLDTLTEYPALFQRLGLTGPESLGLINQALEGGARNSDLAADALKEFQIRATDASETSAEGFRTLGLDAEDMTAKIAAGGATARDGLDLVLDRLRETEDPVLRNAAAVALFGTQAEDLGNALFEMDLSNAVDQLGQVEGAAQRMFDTIADNDATKIEQAGRNIEVAMDGIKGALAAGFSEPLADAADFISRNRGPVLQFFLDLANGALDFGDSLIEGTAAGTEALGEFAAGPLADFVYSMADILGKLPWPFNQDTSGLKAAAEEMRGFDDVTQVTADTIRELGNGAIDEARQKLNEFGEGAVAMGYLNDASLRLGDAIAEVGANADGTKASLEGIDFANLSASDSGRQLEEQVRGAVAALGDQITAADLAGESQGQLRERYMAGRDALILQMEQMGLTKDQAQQLIDTVLQTPASATTTFGSNATDEQGKVQSLADRIVTLPDGSVVIQADTSSAYEKLMNLQALLREVTGDKRLRVSTGQGGQGGLVLGNGGVIEYMASGGIPGLTPMESVAQVVPASTWRVVGDRSDVPESFIPHDNSPRSWAILLETMRQFGIGGQIASASQGGRESAGGGVSITQYNSFLQLDERLQALALGQGLKQVMSS
ncbi:MAG: hypothetical protein K0S37_1975 [Microbacterium sp.]|jgi:hypothetical protein|nr:hypothetical protein [Microbacterium sp.]